MNATEKAIQLIKKFAFHSTGQRLSFKNAKACALICVDEIIENNPINNSNINNSDKDSERFNWIFWNAVRKEINVVEK